MKIRSTHVKQHYVPDFLLKQWHSVADNKLVQYSWTPRGLDIQRRAAKYVAKETHLYSTTSSSGDRDVSIERNYLGPEIDAPAALVFQQLLAGCVESLEIEKREAWVRFLIAQKVRVPSTINHFRNRAEQVFSEGIDAIASQPGRAGFREYAAEHAPHAINNMAVEVLEPVINSELLSDALLRASWSVFKARWSKLDFLIGDRPLIQVGGMSQNFIIVLPLGPRALFCAASDNGTLKKMQDSDHTSVVRTINKDSVNCSLKYVYAKDDSQRAVVEKYLVKIR